MAKKKKLITLAIATTCFASMLTLGILSAVGNKPTVEVQAATLETESEIAEQYAFGSTLTIPNAQIIYAGESYEAETVVKFPDGKAYSQRMIELTKSGKYVIEYRALVDGNYIYSEKSFVVSNKLYSFKDDSSYAYYGENEQYTELSNGIVASIAKADKFQVNAPIDLSTATRSDEIVKLNFTPKTVGAAEVTTLNVRLTDENDPNNYVTVKLKKASDEWGYMMSYVTVNATDQLPVGRIERANGSVSIYKNNQYGTSVVLSFTARKVTNGASIAFDSQTKQFFINGYLIADLDDFAYVDTLWSGFSTGKAYLSIWSENYAADSLVLFISKIHGYDLSQEVFENIAAPSLEVDLQGYEKNSLPKAIVGKNYTLYNAEAFDKLDGALAVNTSVWYNYYSENRARINVVDNQFYAMAEGVYTIVYEVENSFGKISKVVLDIPTVKLEEATCEFIGLKSECKIGELVKVCEEMHFENVIGNYKVSIKAKLKDSNVEYAVDPENYTFKPLYAGTYTLEFTLTDYVRTTVFEREITATANDTTVFETDEIDLPDFLIKNVKYVLPEIKGYALATGAPVEKTVDIYVKEDEGEATKLSGYEFTPKAQSFVEISYQIAGTTTTLSKNIKVVDVGYGSSIHFEKYFNANIGNITATRLFDRIKLSSDQMNSVNGQMEVEYINPIRWNKFTARLGFDKSEYNWNEFYIRFNDEIELIFKKAESGYLQISINGKQNYEVASLFDEFITDFELSYDNADRVLLIDNTFKFTVNTAINNDTFNGFEANGISLKMGCRGVNGKVALKVYSINECVFSVFDEDVTGPYIYFEKNTGRYTLNDVVTITPAVVFDMFSPVYHVKMFVNKAGAGYITALDGTVLDGTQDPQKSYQIKLSEYGDYRVTYSAEDALGNPSSYSYAINVTDTEKPILTLDTKPVAAKVNTVVEIKNATVSDNLDVNLEVIVNIKKPDGLLERLNADESGKRVFTPTQKGTYVVYYIVSDAEGNTTMAQYSIIVE